MEPEYVFRKGLGWTLHNSERKIVTIKEYTILLEHRRPELKELFYYYPHNTYNDQTVDGLGNYLTRINNFHTWGAAMYDGSAGCIRNYQMDDSRTDFIVLTVSKTNGESVS